MYFLDCIQLLENQEAISCQKKYDLAEYLQMKGHYALFPVFEQSFSFTEKDYFPLSQINRH